MRNNLKERGALGRESSKKTIALLQLRDNEDLI